MGCPHCGSEGRVVRKGSFLQKLGQKTRIRRFLCRLCGRHSSEQTQTLSEGHRRSELNRLIYLLLNSGVSQRTDRMLGTTQTMVP